MRLYILCVCVCVCEREIGQRASDQEVRFTFLRNSFTWSCSWFVWKILPFCGYSITRYNKQTYEQTDNHHIALNRQLWCRVQLTLSSSVNIRVMITVNQMSVKANQLISELYQFDLAKCIVYKGYIYIYIYMCVCVGWGRHTYFVQHCNVFSGKVRYFHSLWRSLVNHSMSELYTTNRSCLYWAHIFVYSEQRVLCTALLVLRYFSIWQLRVFLFLAVYGVCVCVWCVCVLSIVYAICNYVL